MGEYLKVTGREVRVGDSINVPGARLHEDLAGLSCTLKVDKLEREEQPGKYQFKVWDKFSGSWTWFEDEEELHIYRPSDR